mmetsp:Transcript_908/g.2823  ORF Transcript_908/g.2823 Transcript_908/m.2823 type:complete len:81 (-) Transcript_908:817-1059(-)
MLHPLTWSQSLSRQVSSRPSDAVPHNSLLVWCRRRARGASYSRNDGTQVSDVVATSFAFLSTTSPRIPTTNHAWLGTRLP